MIIAKPKRNPAAQKPKKKKPDPVCDPDTGEILLPWGTMEEELVKMGLI